MVRGKNTALRKAFTMIELVFAIVIIAISMLAIPMVMQVNARNQEGAIFQEGILITSTKISQALSFPWDVASSGGGTALMSISNVLNTGSATVGFGRVNDALGNQTDRRIGHFAEDLRRRLTPSALPRNASPIASDNSIANQHGQIENLGGGGALRYKKQWRITTNVSYISDNPINGTTYASNNISFDFGAATVGTSNIKMIEVTATDVTPGSAGDIVRLSSVSSNIGEVEFFKRRY